ncbi:MAG: transcriptional regulator [Thermoleophilia bacterium]
MSSTPPTHGRVALLTIVAESILEPRVERELRACGASGWTVTAARGEGSRNRRVGDLDGGNVRIEALVSNETAAQIMQRLADDYFTHYAIVAWIADVEVHRSERYT